VMWGTTWPVVRVGLQDLPPFTFAGVRFLVAASVLILVALVRRAPVPRAGADWLIMLGTGLSAIAVTYACQFWGMQHVESGVAAVLFATVPLLTLVIAHVLLPDEPMTLTRLVGVVLGTGGVALIFSDRLSGQTPMAAWAILGFLVGAVALAHAQVVVRGHGHRFDPVLLAAVQTAVGGTVLFAIGATTEGPVNAAAWSVRSVLAVAYLSLIGTAVGFVALYTLLRRMPVTRVNTMMLVHPLVAIAIGWAFLGERLGWQALLGAGAILTGLAPLVWPGRVAAPRMVDLLPTGEFQIEGAA